MRTVRALLTIATVASTAMAPAAAVQAPAAGFGMVHMPISCAAAVQPEFDRGLALLHSFWYDRARTVFDGVITRDSQCRVAYWGAAMTLNHPLWSPPTATDVAAALAYIARGRAAATGDERERGLFESVAVLYGDGSPASTAQRNIAYRDAMVALSARFPDDETQLFTALAIMGAGGSRAEHERAAALAEAVHARQPHHPGALHYLIHAYDVDGLYERGLPAAYAYAASAPAIPHALHMPSHIFNALGYWQESADSNRAAFAASSDAVRESGEDPSNRDFHTLSFGQYALLQLGRYAQARAQAVIALDQYDANIARIARENLTGDERDELRGLDFEATMMSASYMIESGDYTLLARLPADPSEPIVRGMINTARSFAAAATHDDAAMTREDAAARAAVANPPKGRGNPWYVTTVGGWESIAVIARARGDGHAAAAALERAMSAESEAAKHWQPTLVPIPAHELAGRWALQDGAYAEAAGRFRISLSLYPRRPLALYGMATALKATNDATGARSFAQQFLSMWAHADPNRNETALAKRLGS